MKRFITALLALGVCVAAYGQPAPAPDSHIRWTAMQPYSHIRWTSGVVVECPSGYRGAVFTNGMMTCVAMGPATQAMTVPPPSSDASWTVAEPNSHIRWTTASWVQCPDGTRPSINRDGTMTCISTN